MPENTSWEPRELAQDRWFRTTIGPLNLILLRRFDEWRVGTVDLAQFSELPESGHRKDLPSSIEWERWDCDDDDSLLHLLPSFPEWPIVAKPNTSLTIAPYGHALFYVGIPASIEVRGQCSGEMRRLTLVPTDSLSKTWHGDRSEGEPCYSLRTRARRHFDPEDWLEHDVIVAVDLVNEGEESFEFERLFLDLGHFSIFHHGGRLWSNACRIRITEDEEEGNDITYAPKPLDPATDATEVAHARAGKTRRSKLRRAFASVIDVIN
ncbi:MAG: hypothetical protein CMP28_03040 [Roseibacillus sp.]|nr:hypothetical protein [Roseibacillus sp.]